MWWRPETIVQVDQRRIAQRRERCLAERLRGNLGKDFPDPGKGFTRNGLTCLDYIL